MRRDELAEAIRGCRARYDRMRRAQRAQLQRKGHEAKVLRWEGLYWNLIGETLSEEPHLVHVVFLFPHAEQRRAKVGRFSFGQYLRTADSPSEHAMRRILSIQSSDDVNRDALDRQLRASLTRVARPLDWGEFGVDVLWFFAESGRVRRRWAEDFYAPIRPSRAEPKELSV